MKVLIISTKMVDDTKEITSIKNLFDTEVVQCEQYLDVIKAVKNSSFDILHFPSHGDVNQLLLKNGILSSKMFNTALRNQALIFVNACYTITMASVLNTQNSISWRDEVEDKVAVDFSDYFYTGLFASNDIKQAYDSACEMLLMKYNTIELPIILSKEQQSNVDDDLSNFVFNIAGNVTTLIGQQK